MPTITVEDGSGVANANSYVTIAYLDAFATDRGLTIPSTSDGKAYLLIKAFDYLEGLRKEYQGSKASDTQPSQWPRKEVLIDGIAFAIDEIPEELKKAQCQLVIEQQAGTVLYPKPRTSTTEGLVSQKTVGPITKKFFTTANGTGLASPTNRIRFASVEAYLAPLLKGGCSLETVR